MKETEERVPTVDSVVDDRSAEVCCILDTLVKHRFPQSPHYTEEDRLEIIRKGRPHPDLKMFDLDTKQYTAHPWLTACPTLKALFCWPCVLFSKGTVWSSGVTRMNIVAGHSSSIFHVNCQQLLDRWSDRVKSQNGETQSTSPEKLPWSSLAGVHMKTSVAEPLTKILSSLPYNLSDKSKRIFRQRKGIKNEQPTKRKVPRRCIFVSLKPPIPAEKVETASKTVPVKQVIPTTGDTIQINKTIPLSETPPPRSENLVKIPCLVTALAADAFSSDLWSEDRDEIVRNGPPPVQLKELLGENASVPWLTAPRSLKTLFCWPCLLFDKDRRRGVINHKVGDVKNNIAQHEMSFLHRYTSLRLTIWELNVGRGVEKTGTSARPKDTNISIQKRLLTYLIDIVCCVQQKSDDQLIVKLMNDLKFRDIQMTRLAAANNLKAPDETDVSKVVSSFSVQTVKVVRDLMLERLIAEIKRVQYLSLVLSAVQDTPWLSVVVRYVLDNGTLVERFVTFVRFRLQNSVDSLVDRIQKVVDCLGCRHNFVAYTYDVIASKLADTEAFHTKMLSSFPKVKFFHDITADLRNIVLQSIAQLDCCREFFHHIRNLVAFFSTGNDAACVAAAFSKIDGAQIGNFNLSSDWGFVVESFSKHYRPFMTLFHSIITSDDWADETVLLARQFLVYFQSKDGRFFLALISKAYADVPDLTSSLIGQFKPKIWEEDAVKLNDKMSQKQRFQEVKAIHSTSQNVFLCDKLIEERPAREHRLDYYFNVHKEVVTLMSTTLLRRGTALKDWSFLYFLTNPKIPLSPDAVTSKFGILSVRCPSFDLELLKSQLIYVHGKQFWCQANLFELVDYIHRLGLTEALPEVTKFFKFALSLAPIDSTNNVSAAERITSYVKGTQHLDPLKDLLSVERTLLDTIRKEPDFHEQVTRRLTATR